MTAILFSQMQPPAGWEDDFHDWYDTEHIPIRLALPGMRHARRYEAIESEPKFLAIYTAADLGVFASPQFHAIRKNPSERTRRMLANVSGFTRFVCDEVSDTGGEAEGEYLSVNAFSVPPEHASMFDDWYESEHIPRLMRGPDWLRVRRFHVTEGEGGNWTHLALHDLASVEAMNSPERAFARTGPKRDRLAAFPFFAASGRWLYGRLKQGGG